MPAPAAEADRAGREAPTARTAPSAPAREPESPPAPQQLQLAEADDSESDAIVVTGSRISRPNLSSTSPLTVVGEERITAERGDWNACTVQDPARNLSACRRQVDPAAQGRRGQSSAYLADGLAQSWQGRQDQAMAAFDRAIAADPRSALAHLNRGLAWQSRGNSARALADLDRAVRLAPLSARNYFHRARLLRQRGDVARARADEKRAVELDPRYADVIGEP